MISSYLTDNILGKIFNGQKIINTNTVGQTLYSVCPQTVLWPYGVKPVFVSCWAPGRFVPNSDQLPQTA